MLFGKTSSWRFITKKTQERVTWVRPRQLMERQNRNVTLPLPSLNMHVIDIRSEEVHGFSRYHLWDISAFAANFCQVEQGGNWTFQRRFEGHLQRVRKLYRVLKKTYALDWSLKRTCNFAVIGHCWDGCCLVQEGVTPELTTKPYAVSQLFYMAA